MHASNTSRNSRCRSCNSCIRTDCTLSLTMVAEEQPSMSYILGLNQLAEGQFNYETSDTSEFLVGLNTLPSANSEGNQEDMSNIANQLALWTNANFSFDGPTGHALLGDEDKDNDPAAPHHHDEEESRLQRYAAASSTHSNAARDKNRERAEADLGTAAPLEMHAGRAEPVSASWPAITPSAPPTNARPGQPGIEPWDLTSTLALQYLLSRNNSATDGRLSAHSANVSPAAPAPAPPSQRSDLFSHLVQAAMAQPSSGPSSGPGSGPSSSTAGTSSISNVLEAKPEPEPETETDNDNDIRASVLRRNGHAERVKLVDTGNPEADAEANRSALEEDKRRRNTAASARFRIKKKQREAALEMAARELETRVSELKQENERLRTENDWLKRLISGRPENIGLSTHHTYIAPEPDALHARNIFRSVERG